MPTTKSVLVVLFTATTITGGVTVLPIQGAAASTQQQYEQCVDNALKQKDLKWRREKLAMCEQPQQEAPTVVTNNTANGGRGGDGGKAHLENVGNAKGGDAESAAKAVVEANPEATIGDIANHLENTLNLSPSQALEVANRVKQSQTAIATSEGSEQSQTLRGGNNDIKIDASNRSKHKTLYIPGAATPAPAGSCSGEIQDNQKGRVVRTQVGLKTGLSLSGTGDSGGTGSLSFVLPNAGLSGNGCLKMLESEQEGKRLIIQGWGEPEPPQAVYVEPQQPEQPFFSPVEEGAPKPVKALF